MSSDIWIFTLKVLDDQICSAALSVAGCPLGTLRCPQRHTEPSPLNFQNDNFRSRDRERLSTVCKHWLRGLCKKGDDCEFLHEYNLRRMPECWWYARYGYCSSGDECLYAHPKERKKECPDYKRGFCKLGKSSFQSMQCEIQTPLIKTAGPECPRKHVRRVICQNYLTGFCPMGPECDFGQ